jgi:hypothetical protein
MSVKSNWKITVNNRGKGSVEEWASEIVEKNKSKRGVEKSRKKKNVEYSAVGYKVVTHSSSSLKCAEGKAYNVKI